MAMGVLQDIHNDHSPYQFEPAESLKEHRPFDGAADSRQQQQAYEPKRPVRKPTLYKDFGDYEKYKIKSKWYSAPAPIVNAEPSTSYATFYAPQEPRPFWQRISEMIRSGTHALLFLFYCLSATHTLSSSPLFVCVSLNCAFNCEWLVVWFRIGKLDNLLISSFRCV
jgi:hypothetical protein